VVGTEAKSLGDLLTEIRRRRTQATTSCSTTIARHGPAPREQPKDFDAFVEGITLYHIIIEATIALTGQRFELESMRELATTDRGFYRGFTAIARDESRHVSFGIKSCRRRCARILSGSRR